MKLWLKFLIVIELLLGFGLVTFLWFAGCMILVSGVFDSLSSQATLVFDKHIILFYLFFSTFLVMGGYGIRAVFALFLKTINSAHQTISAKKLKRYLVLGITGLLGAMILFSGSYLMPSILLHPSIAWVVLVFIAPPLLVTTHWVYYCRGYLWKK